MKRWTPLSALHVDHLRGDGKADWGQPALPGGVGVGRAESAGVRSFPSRGTRGAKTGMCDTMYDI